MAEYTDKDLMCVECGTGFTFTASQQERFADLGLLNDPKRCLPCRAKKRAGNAAGPKTEAGDAGREYHTAKCAECGQQARLPFKPRNNRPVYCSDCFAKRR